MRLEDTEPGKLRDRLSQRGLTLRTGRFTTCIRSSIEPLANEIINLYGQSELVESGYIDFNVELNPSSGLRRYYRPQVNFSFNGLQPFAPLPVDQCLPLMEWGLNWCVSTHFHQCLIIHAAVVEKYGKSLVLPGQPGSGKSTLCAALVTQGGFRLLSDELTLIDPDTGRILPNPRPVSLKNRSIDIVKEINPSGYFSSVVSDTIKGTVCLMAPPEGSYTQFRTCAEPGLVIFPTFDQSFTSFELEAVTKGRTFLELANQSFNYSILGETGFKAIGKHLDFAEGYNFRYDGNLEQAVAVIDEFMQ